MGGWKEGYNSPRARYICCAIQEKQEQQKAHAKPSVRVRPAMGGTSGDVDSGVGGGGRTSFMLHTSSAASKRAESTLHRSSLCASFFFKCDSMTSGENANPHVRQHTLRQLVAERPTLSRYALGTSVVWYQSTACKIIL